MCVGAFVMSLARGSYGGMNDFKKSEERKEDERLRIYPTFSESVKLQITSVLQMRDFFTTVYDTHIDILRLCGKSQW